MGVKTTVAIVECLFLFIDDDVVISGCCIHLVLYTRLCLFSSNTQTKVLGVHGVVVPAALTYAKLMFGHLRKHLLLILIMSLLL